ncbi:MAG: methyltransferase domain-containing protein [Jatrophihabitantaceae bacterium]
MSHTNLTKPSPYRRLYEEMPNVWGLSPGRLMPAICSLVPPGWAADLGCGEGRNSVYLGQCGWRVRSVDSDPIAARRAKQRITSADLIASVDVSCADYSSLLYDGKAYDLMLAYGFLHCLNISSLQLLLNSASKMSQGAIFAGSALTSGAPMPPNHGTENIFLRSEQEYFCLLNSSFDILIWEPGNIRESHHPVIGDHEHTSIWFIARTH